MKAQDVRFRQPASVDGEGITCDRDRHHFSGIEVVERVDNQCRFTQVEIAIVQAAPGPHNLDGRGIQSLRIHFLAELDGDIHIASHHWAAIHRFDVQHAQAIGSHIEALDVILAIGIDEDEMIVMYGTGDAWYNDTVGPAVHGAAEECHVVFTCLVHQQFRFLRSDAGVVVVDHEGQGLVRPGHRALPGIRQRSGLIRVVLGRDRRVSRFREEIPRGDLPLEQIHGSARTESPQSLVVGVAAEGETAQGGVLPA